MADGGYSVVDESLIQVAMETGDPGKAERALADLDSAIQGIVDKKQKADLILRKAVLYGVLRRFDEAKLHLELALNTKPDDDSVRLQADFIEASLYDQQGEPNTALARLTELLTNHRDQLRIPEFRFIYEDVQQRRGFDLVATGDFEQALPVLSECLSFVLSLQDRSNVLAKLGFCHSQLEDYAKAKEYFLAACKIGLAKEMEGDVHLHLGAALAQLGQLQESRREFGWCEKRAVELGIDLREVYRWLAWVCNGLGERAEAERYARMAANMN